MDSREEAATRRPHKEIYDSSESPQTYSDSTQQRQAILGRIVTKSRQVFGLPQLERTQLALAVAAWEEIVEDVPTEWLEEAYRRGVVSHDGRQNFNPGVIVRAYGVLVASGEVQRRASQSGVAAAAEERCPEYGCSIGGWITVDPSGRIISGDYSGPTFTRACPVHRARG
jgi:hypothetical protein